MKLYKMHRFYNDQSSANSAKYLSVANNKTMNNNTCLISGYKKEAFIITV